MQDREQVTAVSGAARLRALLDGGEHVRVIGASDALVAKLAHNYGFEAIWASGFAISASYGVPDAGILSMKEMLESASVMAAATPLPVIADCDSGFGDAPVVRHMVRSYEHHGVAAVCIEDKVFPKRNSFRPGQKLAEAEEFATKVEAAAAARTNSDFCVIARIEALISGAGMEEALKRGALYEEAGADIVLIHSKSKTPAEVDDFAAAWRELGHKTPLAIVPTTYPSAELALLDPAIRVVIYANQALRASVQAMQAAFDSISILGSTVQIEDRISSMHEVFDLVGTQDVDDLEAWFERRTEQRRAGQVQAQNAVPTL